ncbi:unnamed protein product [Moneuplotes crassus]|uniref:Uncharacterized protein n=1 Tax=Euplotes crassus TaxID=5936 RepID=A0AAD1XYY7_EUPCR|nr:unnamed protein product [Moneuplotes crassus]
MDLSISALAKKFNSIAQKPQSTKNKRLSLFSKETSNDRTRINLLTTKKQNLVPEKQETANFVSKATNSSKFSKRTALRQPDIDKISSLVIPHNDDYSSEEESESETHTYSEGEFSESFSVEIKDNAEGKHLKSKETKSLKEYIERVNKSDYSYDPSKEDSREFKLPPKPDGKYLRRTRKNYEIIQNFIKKQQKVFKKQKSVKINTLVDVQDPNSALLGENLHNKEMQRSSTRFNNSYIVKNRNSLFGGESISGFGKQKSILKKPSNFEVPKSSFYNSQINLEDSKVSKSSKLVLKRKSTKIEIQDLESFVNSQTNLKPNDDQDELDSLPSYVSEAAMREDFNTDIKPRKSTLADNPHFPIVNISFPKNDSLNNEITPKVKKNNPLEFPSLKSKMTGITVQINHPKIPNKSNNTKSSSKNSPHPTPHAITKSPPHNQPLTTSQKPSPSHEASAEEDSKTNLQPHHFSTLKRSQNARRGAFRAITIFDKDKMEYSAIGNAPDMKLLEDLKHVRPVSSRPRKKSRRKKKYKLRNKLGPAPKIDIDQEIFRDRERRARREMKRINVLRDRELKEYNRTANPWLKKSRNGNFKKIDLNTEESRKYRSHINPLIFGSEFYFTEKSLKMHKPSQYPFDLKHTIGPSIEYNKFHDSQFGVNKGESENTLIPGENSRIHSQYFSSNREFDRFIK